MSVDIRLSRRVAGASRVGCEFWFRDVEWRVVLLVMRVAGF